MPSPSPVLHSAQAGRIVADHGFVARPPSSERLVGLEFEWLTVCLQDPEVPAAIEHVRAVAESLALPHGSRITYEPGGQVELSTAPAPGLGAIEVLAADAAALGRALAEAGIGLVAIGLEPRTHRARVVHSPRYDAMESYFDASGDAGRTMMRSTAAIQVNLDLGPPREIDERWRHTHALGPVLAAAFANSPFADGRPTGWRSTRLAVWHAIDPTRTLPAVNGVDCRQAWARYALDADVMLVRRSATEHVALPPGLTFAEWIEHGHALGWPTPDDLEYHLGTLFPPVRPRGYLEVRYLDSQPAGEWIAPAAVIAALLADPPTVDAVRDICAPVGDRWRAAARHGLADPAIAAVARKVLGLACARLHRTDLPAPTRQQVHEIVCRRMAGGGEGS